AGGTAHHRVRKPQVPNQVKKPARIGMHDAFCVGNVGASRQHFDQDARRIETILMIREGDPSGGSHIVAASKQGASMRFPILVAAAAISSGVAVFSFKTFFPQQNAYLTATARKAMSEVAGFNFSTLNPVQSAYDRVARDVASPKPIEGLNFKPVS